MTAKPIRKCPKCGQKVQRLLGSGSGIVFKGSGFYQTDYKNKPKETAPANKKDASHPSKEGKPSSEKSGSASKQDSPPKKNS